MDAGGSPPLGESHKPVLAGLREGSNDAFLPHENGPEKGWNEAIHPIWVKQIWLYRGAGVGVP